MTAERIDAVQKWSDEQPLKTGIGEQTNMNNIKFFHIYCLVIASLDFCLCPFHLHSGNYIRAIIDLILRAAIVAITVSNIKNVR